VAGAALSPTPQVTAARPAGPVSIHTAAPARAATANRQQPAENESDEPPSAEDGPPLQEKILRSTPPWLVSAVVHLVVLLVLAFISLPTMREQFIDLTATYSDYVGKQLESLQLSTVSDLEKNLETDFALADNPVEDPLAAPPQLQNLDLAGLNMTSDISAPTIGTLLSGREAGSKKALLAVYGGTASTEAAVRAGLEWLKKQQQKDGSWLLNGPYQDGGIDENRPAATAMAMLAFQGAGHTHLEGEFKPVVAKGMTALLKMQDNDGNFIHGGPRHHRLYSQAQATIAICELYGMTKDEKLREPAQRAVNYCVEIQSPEGGWRYDPKVDSDLSVTGWVVMALQSARMAGLEVPSYLWDDVSRFLDSVQHDGGSRYAYQPNAAPRIAMTAEGLLCRQYIGWAKDDLRLVRGMDELLRNPIDWDRGNVYYWYYATQVLHHAGGKEWYQWNNVMRTAIPQRQVANGPEKGSWEPTGDAHDRQGGRLYVTSLCIFMLEVYYRHLPIYRH
jgi:hypothetical protein